MPRDLDPNDIVTRLTVLARIAEIGITGVTKKHIARIARDAAGEILRLREEVEGLTAQIRKLQREGC
jgi:hypothetical protein